MKRRELLKRISQEAKTQGIEWVVHREGANHTVFRLGRSHKIPIPQHNEIGDRLAEAIFRECETELGQRWWK